MTGKESPTWTLAYRTPRANHFRRCADWAGTWQEAYDQAQKFGRLNPHLQVYYTSTRAAELAGDVVPEDCANILTESGRRVAITDDGTITHGWTGAQINADARTITRRMSRPEAVQALYHFGMGEESAARLLAWITDDHAGGVLADRPVPAAGASLVYVPESGAWEVTYPAPSNEDIAALNPRPAPEPPIHALPVRVPGVAGVIVFALHNDPEASEESAVVVVRREGLPESRAYSVHEITWAPEAHRHYNAVAGWSNGSNGQYDLSRRRAIWRAMSRAGLGFVLNEAALDRIS